MKKLLPICALLFLSGCGGEPNYNGKPAIFWVAGLEDPDPEIRASANAILLETAAQDRNVINALLTGIKNGNSVAPDILGEVAPNIDPAAVPDIIKVLGDTVQGKGNLSVRMAAARTIPKFGRAAGPAVPALVAMLKDDTAAVLREKAAETLGQIPHDLAKVATPDLMRAAKTDVLSVQHEALKTLRAIDPEALQKATGP